MGNAQSSGDFEEVVVDLPEDFAAHLMAEMDHTQAREYVDLLLEICEYHSSRENGLNPLVTSSDFQIA